MEKETIVFDIKDLQFFETDVDEAFASVSLNPTFRWCKFILTDDQPNLNKKRIPVEEFDNLIKTGIFAPIKMEKAQIGDHKDSEPIGVITALKKENNYVKGIAALWSQERPEDVAMIKELYDAGQPLNLSWEVLFSEKVPEENDVVALKNTALRATTFVRLPAYEGRTPVLEFSSVQENIPITEDSNLNELEQANARIAELEALVAQKDADLAAKDAELASLKSENESLASFKLEVEAEKARNEKLAGIKVKFSEAGINKDEVYFTDNSEKLLSMDENALDFMLQELVSFASTNKPLETSSSVELPLVTRGKVEPKELGRKLRNAK